MSHYAYPSSVYKCELQINSSYVHHDTSQWMALVKLSITSNSHNIKTLHYLSITNSVILWLIYLYEDSFFNSLVQDVPKRGGSLHWVEKVQWDFLKLCQGFNKTQRFNYSVKCCVAYIKRRS